MPEGGEQGVGIHKIVMCESLVYLSAGCIRGHAATSFLPDDRRCLPEPGRQQRCRRSSGGWYVGSDGEPSVVGRNDTKSENSSSSTDGGVCTIGATGKNSNNGRRTATKRNTDEKGKQGARACEGKSSIAEATRTKRSRIASIPHPNAAR